MDPTEVFKRFHLEKSRSQIVPDGSPQGSFAGYLKHIAAGVRKGRGIKHDAKHPHIGTTLVQLRSTWEDAVEDAERVSVGAGWRNTYRADGQRINTTALPTLARHRISRAPSRHSLVSNAGPPHDISGKGRKPGATASPRRLSRES